MAVVDRIAKYFKMDEGDALQLVSGRGGMETLSPRCGGGQTRQGQDAELHRRRVLQRAGTQLLSTPRRARLCFFLRERFGVHLRPRRQLRMETRDSPRFPRNFARREWIQNAGRVSIIAWGWVDQDRDDISAFKNWD